MNSEKGIALCLEAPFSRNDNLNIFRPAVLRQYYGADCHYTKQYNGNVRRFSYGVGFGSAISSVGTDEDMCVTREFSKPLVIAGDLLNTIIFHQAFNKHKLFYDRRHQNPIHQVEYNHCTVLLYYSIDGMKMESKLGEHCDCSYKKDGSFNHSANSQAENTITASVTIGDSRVVSFYLRSLCKENCAYKSGIWNLKKESITSMTISHGDIMVIHPDDERPFNATDDNGTMLRQILHGNVKVDKGNFSVGFVFRNVAKVDTYSRDNNMLVSSILPSSQTKSDNASKIDNENISRDLNKYFHQPLVYSFFEALERNKK